MNNKPLSGKCWLGMAALFVLGAQLSQAASTPLFSGSYQVLKNKNDDLGSHSQIQLRIRLVNHSPADVSVQRMTLWDSSHAEKGGTSACLVSLRAHSSAVTTQQFTIRRSDYQLWQKGFRPRLVLQLTGPGPSKSKVVVRLDRISGREAK